MRFKISELNKEVEDLKKQLSEKAFEQAVGFLRVPESPEILDTTDIHPEQYALARYLQNAVSNQALPFSTQLPLSQPFPQREKGEIKHLSHFFTTHTSEIIALYPDATEHTLEFILRALAEAGREKRAHSAHQKATFRGAVDHRV